MSEETTIKGIEKWRWKKNYCQKKNLYPAQYWLWEEADRKYEEQLKEQGK